MMNKRLLPFKIVLTTLLVLSLIASTSALAQTTTTKRHRTVQQGYSMPEGNTATIESHQGAGLAPVSPIVPREFRQPEDLQMPVERPPTPPAPQKNNGHTTKISVTATDRGGRWVPDLSARDIDVVEDGQQRQILSVQRDSNTPVSIGLVVDTTGSMESKIGAAKTALAHFIGTLGPDDEAFIIAFSTRSFLLQDFTSDRSRLSRTLGLLHPDGRTALYDAVINGLRKVQQGRWRKRALLVVTDGIDNTSSHPLDDAIAEARRDGVLIYTVGIGSPGGGGGASISFGPIMIGGDPDDERVDDATLHRLSDETGATTFVVAARASNMGALDSHFQAISNELRQQYTVAYASDSDRDTHSLRVDSRRDDVVVRGPKFIGHGGGTATSFAGADGAY
jgi:Ca-activated chloride channel family protein